MIVGGVALIHFVASWIAFTRSSVITATELTPFWRSAAEILAFPLIYLSQTIAGSGTLPLLMVMNSAIWGIAIALVLAAIRRRRR